MEAHAPQQGDFLVGDIIIEVGGKVKTLHRLKSIKNYLADDIETGIATKVPL